MRTQNGFVKLIAHFRPRESSFRSCTQDIALLKPERRIHRVKNKSVLPLICIRSIDGLNGVKFLAAVSLGVELVKLRTPYRDETFHSKKY